MPRTQYTHSCTYCGGEFLSRYRVKAYCSIACANRDKRPRPIEERFWEKVDKRGPDECWPWLDVPNAWGYGMFRIGKRKRPAHRLAYEFTHGPIPSQAPDGRRMFACHKCDNPICCNPVHIFPGTDLDNNRDRHMKGRDAKGDRSGRRLHPERYTNMRGRSRPGMQNPTAKLTDDQVIAIRRRFDAGDASIMALAREYHMSHGGIQFIVQRKSCDISLDPLR
jgi:hypothetical protein